MKNEYQSAKITNAEWEVMRVVWASEGISSKAVTEILKEKMAWKSTTVKTLLSRLVEKEALITKRSGNKYLYYPLFEERKSIEELSREVLTKVCSKKIGEVLQFMVNESTLCVDDIDQLEVILNKKRKTAVKEVRCNCIPGQCQCHLIKN